MFVKSIFKFDINVIKYKQEILQYNLQCDSIKYHHLVDVFKSISELQNLSIPDNYVLITLEIISLFNNIPSNFTINIQRSEFKISHTFIEFSYLRLLEGLPGRLSSSTNTIACVNATFFYAFRIIKSLRIAQKSI